MAAATAVEVGVMVSQAINVIAAVPDGIVSNVGVGVGVDAAGGSGKAGGQRRTAEPVPPAVELPAMEGPSLGTTPEMLPQEPKGGSGKIGGLGPLLVGAFITAVADMARQTITTSPGKIINMPGPPQLKGAIAAGLLLASLNEQVESLFTHIMGERTGRFEHPDRPETEPSEPVPEFQVERPARGFLVDLSQRFVPPVNSETDVPGP